MGRERPQAFNVAPQRESEGLADARDCALAIGQAAQLAERPARARPGLERKGEVARMPRNRRQNPGLGSAHLSCLSWVTLQACAGRRRAGSLPRSAWG